MAALFAKQGEKSSLRILMEKSENAFGRGAEGGAWINGTLWDIMETQAQLTVELLSEIPSELRMGLMSRVYTQPVHDGFDFIAIRNGLRRASVPEKIRKEVAQIIEVCQGMLDE